MLTSTIINRYDKSNMFKAINDMDKQLNEAISIIDSHGMSIIRKTRYVLVYCGYVWEVDEFHDENSGLIVAEIELNSIDETFDLPPWVGEEVTADYRYLNSNLAINPFGKWR